MTSYSSLLIVGQFDGTHLGASLLRAAETLRLRAHAIDLSQTQSRTRLVNAIAWRLLQKRPPFVHRLDRSIAQALSDQGAGVIITTGIAPVSAELIEACQARGCVCLHFSTDDPWNPSQFARWHLEALKAYDIVFTPRRANLNDLEALPCRKVEYLPFAYDPSLFGPGAALGDEIVDAPVLFVGGADTDRIGFFERFTAAGAPIILVGGYWRRHKHLAANALGLQTPRMVAALTRNAKVSLCLNRRANRDGHVMRSFEIAALGGCMLAEDSGEHRDIFGKDGECVRYFSSPEQAAHRAIELLGDEAQRQRLARTVQARIIAGAHTYSDRLDAMLKHANASIARRESLSR